MTAPAPPARAAPSEGGRRPREIQLNPRYGTGPAASAGAPPAMFLVHDGFGETLHYRNLARHLDRGQAVYGLYPMANERVVMIQTRIKDIAAAYVARIRRVQPEGPYLLGGLCAGGVIASEMARQLQADGLSVGLLALLDSADLAAHMKIGRYTLGKWQGFNRELKQRLSGSGPWASLAALFAHAGSLMGLTREQIGVKCGLTVAAFKARVLRFCLDTGRTPPGFVCGLSVNQIYTLAESSPVSEQPFMGDVLLFRATRGNGDFADEPFRNLFNDPLLGWAARVTGQVTCVDVGGGHYSMLDEPHVRTLAARIQCHVDALSQPRPASTPAGAAFTSRA
ncbi:MAG TPA: thioesterase domain-containing protein [Burkholderiaceae bacterium]|jgi:thioesterase domain-containing protein